MQTIKLTLNKFYTEEQITALQLAADNIERLPIFDSHYGEFVTMYVYRGVLRGSEKFFAVDKTGNVVVVRKDEDGELALDNNQVVGVIVNGRLDSWDADSGDLEIQGLKSNGRYKAAV